MTAGPTSVDALYQIAYQFLQAVVAAMTSTDAGAPARAYVYPDQSPEFYTECSQAAVSVPGLDEGGTSPTTPTEVTARRFHFGRINYVAMTGYAVRCVSFSEGDQEPFQPLSDATLNAQARAMQQDGWALWQTVTKLLQDDLLFEGLCSNTHFDLGRPVRPLGGLAGWSFTIKTQLSGYIPDLVWPPVMPS